MKLLDKIKSRVGQQVLEGNIKPGERKACFCNIKDARNIGIIYNATDLSSFDVVREFSKQLSSEDVSLSILGYVHSKELVDKYLYRKGFDFFYRSNLNWYNKPVSPITDRFISEPFDILIDLSLDTYYPIRYVTALSTARFKAGRFTPDEKYLDLMIDIEKEKAGVNILHEETGKNIESKSKDHTESKDLSKNDTSLRLDYLIKQLIHYLSVIKNK
jgi:hypothetical protein